MTHPVRAPRKLIEVALPLDAINVAAAREKSIRHGHPSTLHLWWARRPLAAARAVLFGQLVNDPAAVWELTHPGEEPTRQQKGGWANARRHLFALITDLVQWENTTNETVLGKAREAIRQSWRETCELNRDHPDAATLFDPDRLPGLHDPFAGGGTIPLEAQRLGLEAHASDLNPVAVLINKAMIEIPPKFAGQAPVGPRPATQRGSDTMQDWPGASGLAEDVRRYGAWMRDEAHKRIGHLYPPVAVTEAMAAGRPDLRPYVGEKLTVIAWLWARTVASPNPAFRGVAVPLASTFILSSKAGKEAWVQPVVAGGGYRFEVRTGTPPPEVKKGTTATGRFSGFRCLMSEAPISYAFAREEAKAGRMGQKLMAIVTEGTRGRVYLTPTPEMEAIAESAEPAWKPDTPLPEKALSFRVQEYGMRRWCDLFTPRQLVALTTFSDLVGETRARVRADAIAAGRPDDGPGLDAGGTGATAYAEAVSVYLSFCVDKGTLTNTTQATWQRDPDRLTQAFSRQALPMTWDFAEANPLSEAGGGIGITPHAIGKVLERLPSGMAMGAANQCDAVEYLSGINRIISTDPPYYDNIGYADLSDYFYAWLRRPSQAIYPSIFGTITVPKKAELIASPHRHGGRVQAEAFFLDGMTKVIRRLAVEAHPAYPTTIFYAFKQSETSLDDITSSTGWETFLDAVVRSGLAIVGTWPMRTELITSLKKSVGALASSIILVCRRRAADAPVASRRQFQQELNRVLPAALAAMTGKDQSDHSPVAPVDLSQAIIGPGMAVFSRYAQVLEANGEPMTVRTALRLINRFLAGDDFDADTGFCLDWFDQHGWEAGPFGSADVLARAKGTSVAGVQAAGVVAAGGGTVRLLKWADYPADWNPAADDRLPVWEVLHQLIRLARTVDERAAGRVLAAVPDKIGPARQLAFRLYTLCERRKWPEDARAYNELMTSWAEIEAKAAEVPAGRQLTIDDAGA